MNTIAERLTASGSPFEVVEASVAGTPWKVFRHAPKTLIDIYRRARSCGDRGFLVSGVRRATYGEIFRISGRISRVIRQRLGDARGARIAVILDNGPEWIASFVAITSMGATVAAVHRASGLGDMASAVDLADCQMVICNEQVASGLSGSMGGKQFLAIGRMGELTGATGSPASGDDPNDSRELPHVHDAVQPESVAMIAFTSGSTSRPKGVELTHRSMTAGMMNALLGGALASVRTGDAPRSPKRVAPAPFLAAPFSHVSGYGTALLSMYVGGRIVTMETWDPKRAVELMLSEETTSLVGTTSQMLRELLDETDLAAVSDFMRSVVVQGTSLPQSLLRELKSAVPHVSIGTGYGLTETNGSVCMGSEAMLSERPNTSGKVLPTVDLKIWRDDFTEAAPGELGEVVIRGAMVMRGYLNLPSGTGGALQDGWFRTGDLGWVDADGFLYLADRADHLLICRGVKVSCSAVERVVVDSNLAAEAVAFGSEDGEQAQSFVLALSRAQDYGADDSAIVDALQKAGYGSMAPRIVRLSISLPRTPSGKIDRREVRRLVLAGESA